MIAEKDFVRIATFIKNKYGIDMSRKKEIVNGRLENHVRAGGYQDFGEYMDAVTMDITGNMEKEMVNLLTTNHTYFMRETEHFDYLKQVVLPWLKGKEGYNKDLSIWCAASSSGEEPYTLAMILKDFFGLEHDKWDTTVLATDVSTDVLKQATAGIYKKEQIESLPENWRRRYFRPLPDGERFEVTAELKKEVLFRKFNLMDPFPFRRKMHVIFLRNVMIYFDGPTKRELVRKMHDLLEPGGYLFIGQTESLDKSGTSFQMVAQSVYRKQEGRSTVCRR